MRHNFRLMVGLVFAVALLSTALIAPGSASARCTTGGMSPAEVDVCTPTAKARLLPNGMLIPPASAPARVKAVIADAEASLAGKGRLVIRPSGTEPVIRVMAEGDDAGEVEAAVAAICAAVEQAAA